MIARSFVAALVALGACADEPPPAPAEPPPTRLDAADVAILEEATLRAGPLVSGGLRARVTAAVRAELAGPVEWVGPEIGDRVGRGDVLARIDPAALGEARASAAAALASARSQLEVARLEAKRTEVLVEAGGLARRDLDQARSQVEAARAAVDQARAQLAASQAQLGDATARSPIDGVVSRRAVARGDVVAAGELLYEVIDPTSMRLDAAVPTEQLAAVEVGAPVEFAVRGYPDRTFRGRITHVAPAADPSTRQIEILVELPNLTGELVAGLFAEGRIATTSERGLIAPLDAITGGDAPAVLAVRDGAVVRVPVTLGLRDDLGERVVVEGDLRAGDVVLARADAAVPPGTRVVVPEPPAPPPRAVPES